MLLAWRERFTGRPLAVLAIAAVIGVVIADFTSRFEAASATFLILAVAAASLTWTRGRGRWAALLVMTVFALAHAFELHRTRLHPLRLALQARATSMPVEVWGRVEPTLRSDLPGGEPGEAFFGATKVRCASSGEEWRGPVSLRLYPGRSVELAAGTYRIEGRVRVPSAPDNPGQFDGRAYRLRLGLVADLTATRVECLSTDRWNATAFLARAADHCRDWVTRMLSADLAANPNERAIILAMALGTIEPEAKDLEMPFRQSGTLHIFAVSGLHVVIVGAIFWMLLRPLGLRRGVMVPLLIAVLFGYAFVTGLRPSAIRAAIMAAVVLTGVAFHRRTDLLNSLGAAALVLIVWDTQQVFAPGFQLSFFVMASIAWLANLFTKPLRPWIDPDPFVPKPLLSVWQKRGWSFRQWFASLFTVSGAAAIGSLPLVFGHFHFVTPVSLVANAVLVPLSFLVLGTAILTLLCGLLQVTFLQVLFSNANLAFAWSALHAAQFFAGIPGGNFHLSHSTLSTQPPAQLTILRLPAGGASQHLRVGDRHWLLDTGSEVGFAFMVRPYLQYSGVDRLDGLILSHSDYEHIGATFRTLREFGSPPVWEPAREPWRWETGGSSFRALHGHGLEASRLLQHDILPLGAAHGLEASLTVLHPTMETWPRRSDDRTLVLRLDLGSFRVVWCNDAGFLAEKTMLQTLPVEALRCDVIVRNQHAGDFSMLPEFLNATRPRAIISSNSTFPPDQTVTKSLRDQCAVRGIQLLDQAKTGAVTICVWQDRLVLKGMRDLSPVTVMPERASHSGPAP